MKRIGILQCLKAKEVCASVGCLKAFLKREAFFERYAGEDAALLAILTCNGCQEERPQEPEADPGILEKLERLEKEQVSVMHAGACRKLEDGKGEECQRMTTLIRMLEERGIAVIRGTHGE